MKNKERKTHNIDFRLCVGEYLKFVDIISSPPHHHWIKSSNQIHPSLQNPNTNNSNHSLCKIHSSKSSPLQLKSHCFSVPLMATITNFLAKRPPYLSPITNTTPLYPQFPSTSLPLPSKSKQNSPNLQTHRRILLSVKATAAPGTQKLNNQARVQRVHSIQEFDDALRAAKNRLVVVEFAESNSENSSKIYPFMVDLSRSCSDVDFLLVMGDESEETRKLCAREKIEQVPHFSFYKGTEKIHEEEGIGPDQLMGDVLYYGDNHSAVVQLHSGEDVEKLIQEHKADDKLIVLDVGLKHCGPCVKVYPIVLKLSRSMEDTAVFARMNGDENDSCMQFLRDMDVVEVPTFLFFRDGEIRGRYVGSGKGELIGEILRYQGVRVTY